MYSEQRAETLFSQFADEDSPDVIGAEGFERLCKEAQVPLDGALPLLLAWQFGSHEIAKISKQEWMEITAALRCVASFIKMTPLIGLVSGFHRWHRLQ